MQARSSIPQCGQLNVVSFGAFAVADADADDSAFACASVGAAAVSMHALLCCLLSALSSQRFCFSGSYVRYEVTKGVDPNS